MIILKLLGIIWALPTTLVGFLFVLLSSPESIRWHNGAFDVRVARIPLTLGFRVHARTFGHVICYKGEYSSVPRIQVHERAHVFQYELFGVLFFIVYPLASLWAWVRGGHGYRDNVFERWAREAEI